MPLHNRLHCKTGEVAPPAAWRPSLSRPALGIALAVLVIGASASGARAGDDGDGSPSIYDRLMQTLGLKNPGAMEYGIDYNERSPLVVPPNRDLPPPQTAAAPPTPDWPKDPDIVQRAKAKAVEKVRPHPDYVIDSSRPLRPDELNVSGGRVDSATAGGSSSDSTTAPPPKKSFFSFDWMKKQEYATFTGEPARTSLTEPPPGYQTPSPDQPYGIAPEHKTPHVTTPSEHGELPR